MALRGKQLTLGLLAVLAPVFAFGQPVPRPYFAVCGSQGNLPTVYFSGVLQGPASAFAEFRAGFQQYLTQQYGYKGAVACLPTNSALNAQNFINNRSTALRNAKRSVVDTGWAPPLSAAAPSSQAAAVPQSIIALATTPSKTSANTGAAGTSTGGNAGSSQSSQMAGVLGSIFGTGSSGSGCGAQTAPGAATATKSTPATSGTNAAGGCQNQSQVQQVSGVLSSIFGSKPSSSGASSSGGSGSGGSGSGSGGGGGQATAKQSPSGSGAVGFGQSPTNKLAVYGCGRQDARVACVTDLTNQNQKDTLMQAAEVWKDAFIVDDRGDRHQRTAGFFLNIDGEQRSQIDVAYGKAVRFVLMFDSVPTKVQKVTLRSGSDSLDVEDINVLVVPAAATTTQTVGQPR